MAFRSGAFKRGAFLQTPLPKINIFNLQGFFIAEVGMTAIYACELFCELEIYTGE
jgi:hypothetical protein